VGSVNKVNHIGKTAGIKSQHSWHHGPET